MKTIAILSCIGILVLKVASVVSIPNARERQGDATPIIPSCESNTLDPNFNAHEVTCLVHETYSTPTCNTGSHPACPASGDDSHRLVPACLSGSTLPTCVQVSLTTTAAPSPDDPPSDGNNSDNQESQDPIDGNDPGTGAGDPSCDEVTNEGDAPLCPNSTSFAAFCEDVLSSNDSAVVSPVCRLDTTLNKLVAKCELDDGTDMPDYSLFCSEISTDDNGETTTTIAPAEPNTDDAAPTDAPTDPPTDPPTDDNTGQVTVAPPVKTTKKPNKKPKPVKKPKCPPNQGWHYSARYPNAGGKPMCFKCRSSLKLTKKRDGLYYCVRS